MIKLAISGCCGRMGSRILELALKDKNFQVVCVQEKKGHPMFKCQLCGFTVTDGTDQMKNADCLIDFTSPEATMEHLEFCRRSKKALVIGATGFSDDQKKSIAAAAKEIPIVFSPNMSIGVNVLFDLLKTAAGLLGDEYHVNIVEAHHIHKKDAPSGTAKQLAQIIKDASGRDTVDIESIREGEIVGDHRVIFTGPLDSIELFHCAKTRDIFAQGALVAAQWIVGKKSGLFTMQDVLKRKINQS